MSIHGHLLPCNQGMKLHSKHPLNVLTKMSSFYLFVHAGIWCPWQQEETVGRFSNNFVETILEWNLSWLWMHICSFIIIKAAVDRGIFACLVWHIVMTDLSWSLLLSPCVEIARGYRNPVCMFVWKYMSKRHHPSSVLISYLIFMKLKTYAHNKASCRNLYFTDLGQRPQ